MKAQSWQMRRMHCRSQNKFWQRMAIAMSALMSGTVLLKSRGAPLVLGIPCPVTACLRLHMPWVPRYS
jgi:sugar (pentulose or hexulose) kinase